MGPPADSITRVNGVPSANSYTPGRATAPTVVVRTDPGSSVVPTDPYHSAPKRATSARLASVSTFCTRVARPRTPRSYGRGGTETGLASPPLRKIDDRALLAGDVAARRHRDPPGSGAWHLRRRGHRARLPARRGPRRRRGRRRSGSPRRRRPERRLRRRRSPGASPTATARCPCGSRARPRRRWPRQPDGACCRRRRGACGRSGSHHPHGRAGRCARPWRRTRNARRVDGARGADRSARCGRGDRAVVRRAGAEGRQAGWRSSLAAPAVVAAGLDPLAASDVHGGGHHAAPLVELREVDAHPPRRTAGAGHVGDHS